VKDDERLALLIDQMGKFKLKSEAAEQTARAQASGGNEESSPPFPL